MYVVVVCCMCVGVLYDVRGVLVYCMMYVVCSGIIRKGHGVTMYKAHAHRLHTPPPTPPPTPPHTPPHQHHTNITQVVHEPSTSSKCLIAWGRKHVVLAFRGTVDMTGCFQNLKVCVCSVCIDLVLYVYRDLVVCVYGDLVVYIYEPSPWNHHTTTPRSGMLYISHVAQYPAEMHSSAGCLCATRGFSCAGVNRGLTNEC